MFNAEPPSTPDQRSRSFRSIPSTTPAGPPPSSDRALPSFTPKGVPPPSSAFGSSQLDTSNAKRLVSNRNATKASSRGRQLPPSSPPEPVMLGADGKSDNGMSSTHPLGLEDDSMMIDDSIQQISPGFGFGYGSMKSVGDSSRYDSPRGSKRGRGGDALRSNQHGPRRIDGFDVQGYAKGIAASARALQLKDTDDLVLDSELLTEPVVAALRERAGPEEVAELTAELLQLWQEHGSLSRQEVESEDVGPANKQAVLKKANMLASLLVLLHIPQTEEGQIVPLPKALLNWLDNKHDPAGNVLDEVLGEKRHGYYASPGFWDAIYLGLNRGRFSTVIQLLEGARFEDNAEQEFNPQQSEGIQVVVQAAIRVLQQCPAVSSQDWDVKGSNWTLWRHQVEQASVDLRDYAEEDLGGGASLWGSALGKSSASLSASVRSRRVEANIPFEIYEPLQDMYTQLRGTPADILKSSFDWLEASITLTVWWDGSEDRSGKGSLTTSRQSLSKRQQSREVDINPLQAYRGHLASSLALAVREDDVREGLDITNDVHLGLACIVLNDAEQAIELCKSWSMPIATSITELASAGGWMANDSRTTIENFDKSDLMVLSYGQPEQQSSVKDRLLEQYARLLASRKVFTSKISDASMEGWEMAMRVLSRLDDVEKAQSMVTELLEQVPLTSGDRIDSVLMLCNDLGFGQHATAISERYANSLTDSTNRYGDALVYYLHAHKFTKAKKVIDVLITSSLIQSSAYPPADRLDQRMREFIEAPKEALNSLASIDLEAAQQLAVWLGGYATLRKFYEIRDEEEDRGTDLRNKTKAATALLAVIGSANDPIRGGLFDANTQVIVPVETLLVLLGECLPLLRDSPSPFTQQELFKLLAAVEDLQTIGPRVFARCEALFSTTVENAFGADVPSPRALLKKEASGTTASSQFSLVGSSILNSKEQLNGSEESGESGMLVSNPNLRRGWDWRKALKRTTQADDVLAILRLTLAERAADAWME